VFFEIKLGERHNRLCTSCLEKHPELKLAKKVSDSASPRGRISSWDAKTDKRITASSFQGKELPPLPPEKPTSKALACFSKNRYGYLSVRFDIY
jgi:hypothetical protein